MKKNRLVADVQYDFLLMGIIAGIKEHRLAWILNQTGYFHFVKEPDIVLEFSDNTKIVISNYTDSSDLHQHYLVRNRLVSSNSPKNQLVLSELKEFDFFLKLHTSVDDFNFDPVISSLKSNPAINYLIKLDLSKVKHKENLLF